MKTKIISIALAVVTMLSAVTLFSGSKMMGIK